MNSRCQICGSQAQPESLCAYCTETYTQFNCVRCGCLVTTSQPEGDVCSGFLDIDVVASLPTELWAELDPGIFANRKLPVMKRLADVLNGGLKSALGVYVTRYDILRESFPDSFTQSHDDYWTDFYS
ncbi:MAG: hypothetical protein Rhob2KO_11850 [Rhodopirellula baltica]